MNQVNPLQNDWCAVIAAVKKDPEAFQFVSAELQKNKVLQALARRNIPRITCYSVNPGNSGHFEWSLAQVIAILEKDGMALKDLECAQDSFTAVQAAVKQNPAALKYATDRVQRLIKNTAGSLPSGIETERH